ncbi:MAG: hypothetical protein F6K28_48815 [Microcoleus sp. SIO2G3]|nr:hypothetical protein [Microcoleus sp. SIO2G3]
MTLLNRRMNCAGCQACCPLNPPILGDFEASLVPPALGLGAIHPVIQQCHYCFAIAKRQVSRPTSVPLSDRDKP